MQIDRVVDNLSRKLGPQFYRQTYTARRDIAFGFAEKAVRGGPPLPNGQRWMDHGGITYRQLEILSNTSQGDEELERRIYQLIFEKIDTTRTVEQSKVSVQDVEAMVEKRVAEILSRKLEQIQASRVSAEQVAKEASDEVLVSVSEGRTEQVYPTGIQGKRRGEVQPRKQKLQAEKDQEWVEKAQQLGIPLVRLASGKIHGNTVNRIKRDWAEYLRNKEAEVAAQPAS